MRSLPVDPRSGPSTPLVDLARLHELTDAEGTTWRRRGGTLEGKALRRGLLDPRVRVLHEHLGETREVPPDGREDFWASACRAVDASPHAHFSGSEFKDEERVHLLVVREDC